MRKILDWLAENQNSNWYGDKELWEDPLGNDPKLCKTSCNITPTRINYIWFYETEEQHGSLQFSDTSATWGDTWHQSKPVECLYLQKSQGLFAVECCYADATGASWGWRINMSQRPGDTLVLQMTNIAPWGEEARAVRMILKANP
ncbi:MAG: hypothetical protein AAGA18_00345 [Verrucomicrobiota bacterium]